MVRPTTLEALLRDSKVDPPTSNQVSTFSRSAMLFRASDPSVASLDTPMVSVGEWYKTAMKGVTPVNK